MRTMQSLWCPFNGENAQGLKAGPTDLKSKHINTQYSFNKHVTEHLFAEFFIFYFLYPWDADKFNTAPNLMGREI